VHVDPTAHRVWGEYAFPAAQDLPCRIPDGDSTDKRPALKPCVLATLGVDRAGPMWGKPAEGKASDKPRTTTRRSEIAPLLARDGVHQGADGYRADAARVPEDHLAALGAPRFITR
jgi:hypothetical protein